MIETVGDLFDAVGGNAAVRRELNLASASHTNEMRKRNSFPSAYWLEFVAFARRAGRSDITLRLLAQIAANRARRPVPSELGEAA